MKFFARTAIAGLALALLICSVSISIPAEAQAYPTYTTWQQGWDSRQYDHGHVMLGTVANFAPYRLTIQRRNGAQQTVDLKNGTVIYPTGATPTPGQRVALVGHYSSGTFIANRVILRP